MQKKIALGMSNSHALLCYLLEDAIKKLLGRLQKREILNATTNKTLVIASKTTPNNNNNIIMNPIKQTNEGWNQVLACRK